MFSVSLPPGIRHSSFKQSGPELPSDLMRCGMLDEYPILVSPVFFDDKTYARTQAFSILRKQMQYRLHPGYIIEIRPTERQLFLLNSVFDFVNVVGDLIDRSVDKAPG